MEQELAPKYPKIQSLYKRGEDHRLIEGDFSLPEFAYLASNQWVGHEKIDGTNVRVAVTHDSVIAGGEVIAMEPRLSFHGRTRAAVMPPGLRGLLVESFTVKGILDAVASVMGSGQMTHDVVLYGEGYGKSIQKGGDLYKPHGVGFILFDVLVGRYWMPWERVRELADALGIESVPCVARGTLHELVGIARDGLASVVSWIPRPAEGLVARPEVPLFRGNSERIIVKLKTIDLGRA